MTKIDPINFFLTSAAKPDQAYDFNKDGIVDIEDWQYLQLLNLDDDDTNDIIITDDIEQAFTEILAEEPKDNSTGKTVQTDTPEGNTNADSSTAFYNNINQYTKDLTVLKSNIFAQQASIEITDNVIESKEAQYESKQKEIETKQKEYQTKAEEISEKKQAEYDAKLAKINADYAAGKYGTKDYSKVIADELGDYSVSSENSELAAINGEIASIKTQLSTLGQAIETNKNLRLTQVRIFNTQQMNYNNIASTLQQSVDISYAQRIALTPSIVATEGIRATDSVNTTTDGKTNKTTGNINWSDLYVEGKGINFNNLRNLIIEEVQSKSNPEQKSTRINSSLAASLIKENNITGEAKEIIENIVKNTTSFISGNVATCYELKSNGNKGSFFGFRLSSNFSLENFAQIDTDSDGFMSLEETQKLVDCSSRKKELMDSIHDKNYDVTYNSVKDSIKKYEDAGDAASAALLKSTLESSKAKIKETKGANQSDLGSLMSIYIGNLTRRETMNCGESYAIGSGGKKTIINGVDVVVQKDAIISNEEIDFYDNYFEKNKGSADMLAATFELMEEKGGNITNDFRNFAEYYASGATSFEPDFELAKKLNIELEEKYNKYTHEFIGWGPKSTTEFTYTNTATGEESTISLYNSSSCPKCKDQNYVFLYLRPKYLLGLISEEEYQAALKSSNLGDITWADESAYYSAIKSKEVEELEKEKDSF
ncbi:MAG: hypothetical protein PHX18_09120 [Candidatus Gastranaerophilales bacterium]|nr:hypothetical protein [Candidatus Gastranaerophilales bacterium]